MPMTAVDLQSVLLTALLNPVVIVVALWMGGQADQWQKVPVAAFAAAAIGSAVIYVAVWLGLRGIAGVGRAAAGVFVAQFLFGLVWASVGYRFGQRRP
jgi:hypothetical protein